MAPQTASFSARYRNAVREGVWREDAHQERLVIALDKLADALVQPQPALERLRQRITGKAQAGKGLYVWGSVGRGKTALVDDWSRWLTQRLAHSQSPAKVKILRLHFQHLVQLINELLGEYSGQADPLEKVAAALVERGNLLVIDEFYVEDIASAMVLARTLKYIFAAGATLVITSNTPPQRLYEGDLHRDRFLPAIAELQANCRIFLMDGDEDMRKSAKATRDSYLGADPTGEKLTNLWNSLEDAPPKPQIVIVNDRPLNVVAKGKQHIWFTFAELFETPRNASDYIWLCKYFDGILVSNMRRLTHRSDYNTARRLVAFVDEAYESRTRLFASNDCKLWRIFAPETQDPAELADPGSMLSALTRDFSRTHSRLYQMSRLDWRGDVLRTD